MQGLTLWKGKNSKDFKFQDKIAKEFVNISGTLCIIHKYVGPYKQDPKDSSLFLPQNEDEINEMTIQDVLFGENRDRKYSEDLYEVKGIYVVTDNDFDMTQFGYMLGGDQIVLEWHINDLIEKIGRKLMTGDVVELVHLREDDSLDSEAGTIKKYYVVQDASKQSVGYGPTWLPHIWRTRCTPIVDTQEYRDILHNESKILANEDIDWLTDFSIVGESDTGVKDLSRTWDETSVNNQQTGEFEKRSIEVIKDHHRQEVEKRSFDVSHLYIKECNEQLKTGLIHHVLNGDGIPANHNGDIIFSGDQFPTDAVDGDHFVRTDYEPPRLFRKVNSQWKKVSDVWRREWVPAHRILESFINNDNKTSIGYHEDQNFDEKQALSEVVLPKAKQPDIIPKK